MTFAGWTLSQLGILFGAGAAAITLLYLLRMRRRRVIVPFAALWERVARESESRQIWRRLRRLFSWLIQLIVLALVCATLGDPRPQVWLRDPVTVAVVIDRSSSMSAAAATAEDGDEDDQTEPRSRLDVAKERAIREVHALGPADRALVITAGEEVSVGAPLSAEATVLVPAIEAIEPMHGEADLARALALAAHAVGGRDGARILVLTDGALDPAATRPLAACTEGEIPCQFVPIGGPTANVAITAFAARRYPYNRDKVEVLTEVRNLGEQPAVVVLDVKAEGVSVGRRTLELQSGQVKREVLSDLDAARARMIARLEVAPDKPGFSTDLGPNHDDAAYAVVPPLKPLELALVSDGTDLFLDAALLTLGEHVRLTNVSLATAKSGSSEELAEADIVFLDVADETLPAELPDAHLVVFDPWRNPGSAFPIAKKKDVKRPFLTEQARKHPLLSHVVLKDVNIARGTTFVTQPGDTVLVRSLGEPLAVVREKERTVIAFGFDPRQSDLPLRAAFPLLIDNIVRFIEQREAGFVASVQIGQSRELALADLGLVPDEVTRVRVAGPDSVEVELPVERGRFRLRALVPGFYTIAGVDGASADAAVEIAVNQANVYASDLTSRLEDAEISADAEAGEPPEPAPISQGPVWSAILLLAAAIIALEWASYHRRMTV